MQHPKTDRPTTSWLERLRSIPSPIGKAFFVLASAVTVIGMFALMLVLGALLLLGAAWLIVLVLPGFFPGA